MRNDIGSRAPGAEGHLSLSLSWAVSQAEGKLGGKWALLSWWC